MMAITTVLWWFMSPRLHEISTLFANIILAMLRIFYIFIILGIITLYYECFSKQSIIFFHRFIRFAINFLFPINVCFGKLIGITKESIRESFISVNNSFIKFHKLDLLAKDILLLLPHCLQEYECSYRVTNDINNCSDCGRCDILKLKQISTKYKINVAIATGGTLARKIIIQTNPKFIIAVACQKDLVDGLLEVFPIPVYGILNERPYGPCINTKINTELIESFLINILSKEFR